MIVWGWCGGFGVSKDVVCGGGGGVGVLSGATDKFNGLEGLPLTSRVSYAQSPSELVVKMRVLYSSLTCADV